MTFNTALLCASPRFSQNLNTARAAHAMPSRAIVAVHMSTPIASRYGNFNIISFSSGVCGSSAFEKVGNSDEADILLVFSKSNFSTIDFI